MSPFLALLLLFCLLSCNNSQEPTALQTEPLTQDTVPATNNTDETTTNPLPPNRPEGACTEWLIYVDGPDEEIAIETSCKPHNGVFHFWPDLAANSEKDLLNMLTNLVSGDYIYFINNHKEIKTNLNKIIGYYPSGRKMVEIDLKDGMKSGRFIVSDEHGKILVYRNYKDGGIQSKKEPYNHDWEFDTETVQLTMNNQTVTEEDGQTVCALTIFEYDQIDNFYQKDIWDNAPLTINGEPFTGILRGYNTQLYYSIEDGISGFKCFEIEFQDGLLDGTFNIWENMMGHMLEEVFEKGNWKETIYKINPDEMDGMAKPVIYLYPPKTQTVNVKLDLQGKIVHPYPRYDHKNGWTVLAQPNGMLTEVGSGKEFYCLYWEGLSQHRFDLSTGFVVKGSETIEFLEEKLALLGLNRREANEMIIYWLPRMENNPYNLIHFSTKEYERIAKLNITPTPDQIIRIMMVFQPLQTPIRIPAQQLHAPTSSRKGFTVVEWGGQEIKQHHSSIQ